MEDKIKVLVVEPDKKPYTKEISNTLEEMQAIVGGYVQVVYPFQEPVGLVCNEEAKLGNFVPNRALLYSDTYPDYKDLGYFENELYDIVYGTFFIVGLDDNDVEFTSLTGEQIVKYRERFGFSEYWYDHGMIDGKPVPGDGKRLFMARGGVFA